MIEFEQEFIYKLCVLIIMTTLTKIRNSLLETIFDNYNYFVNQETETYSFKVLDKLTETDIEVIKKTVEKSFGDDFRYIENGIWGVRNDVTIYMIICHYGKRGIVTFTYTKY